MEPLDLAWSWAALARGSSAICTCLACLVLAAWLFARLPRALIEGIADWAVLLRKIGLRRRRQLITDRRKRPDRRECERRERPCKLPLALERRSRHDRRMGQRRKEPATIVLP